ncbi:MAG: hypothetical protein DHS80DRAFT_16487 [Piptocephalis tieghemiana]|nr:MAG: hypothetical protein DHS80DRAFT_16487 [Piptocephalis tieghemiana]
MKPLCGPGCAIFCTLISIAGIIFLVVMGALFNAGVSQFTESTKMPADHKAVGHGCYMAAAIYVGFLLLSLCQIKVNKRQANVEYTAVATN